MKILVCVIGQLRCTSLTWPGFKKHVLDELNAEFMTCGPDANSENEFTRAAKRNIHSESRSVIGQVNAQIILDHRNVLAKSIHPSEWDQIILTRSDHMWYGPHPKLDLDHFWFMNSEFHFGISDRHTVVSSNFFMKIINLGSIPFNGARNIEQFLFLRMIHLGYWGQEVGLSHFPMYLTDANGDYRRPDELDSSRETITWPFRLVHNEVTKNGMFTGRSVASAMELT